MDSDLLDIFSPLLILVMKNQNEMYAPAVVKEEV